MKRLNVLLSVLILCGCDSPPPRVVLEVPWGWSGETLIADTHTHTTFSDGSSDVDGLVETARTNGCDVVGITDHADWRQWKHATRYVDAISRSRSKFPDTLVITGLELNIAPYSGREHVAVLLRPELERELIPQLTALDPKSPLVQPTLDLLEELLSKPTDGVAFYNHPSRKDLSSQENAKDMEVWRLHSQVVAGFEGGPGHQGDTPIGAYRGKYRTIDRWDPVVAEIGGTWDALLDAGHNINGALATSDFHKVGKDRPPCSFSRIHVRVPERTIPGVLKALRAGSFWSDMGNILDGLEFSVAFDELDVPLVPGEIARASPTSTGRWNLRLKRGFGALESPLTVQVISNCESGVPAEVSTVTLATNKDRAFNRIAALRAGRDRQSCYLRARVIKRLDDEPDLVAYTNAIRILLDENASTVRPLGLSPTPREPESQRKVARTPQRTKPDPKPKTEKLRPKKQKPIPKARLTHAQADSQSQALLSAFEQKLSDELEAEREPVVELQKALARATAQRHETPLLTKNASRKVDALRTEERRLKARIDNLLKRYTKKWLEINPDTREIQRRLQEIAVEIQETTQTSAREYIDQLRRRLQQAEAKYLITEGDKARKLSLIKDRYAHIQSGQTESAPTSRMDASSEKLMEKLREVWRGAENPITAKPGQRDN